MNLNKAKEFELVVKNVEDLLPKMSTPALQRWKAMMYTVMAKIDRELTTTHLHTCDICFNQEYGYRNELPSCWYSKGDALICYKHEYEEASNLLKKLGMEVDAFFPPEIPVLSVETLELQMSSLPPEPSKVDAAFDNLIAVL
jgi:hypothetical protein